MCIMHEAETSLLSLLSLLSLQPFQRTCRYFTAAELSKYGVLYCSITNPSILIIHPPCPTLFHLPYLLAHTLLPIVRDI